MDICEVILSDHHEQRRQFALLDDVDRADTATLGALWSRLSTFLEVHAEAEELYFYPELLALGKRLHRGQDPTETEEAEETEDAIGDHNDIRDGIQESARHPVGADGWWAGVNAARNANDEHMGEEEHEGLKDFREHATLQQRHDIAVRFVAFEAAHVTGVPLQDKDPDAYVEENV